MKGAGTDEKVISAELARIGTQEEWEAIQAAFKAGEESRSFQGGDLRAAIESELSLADLITAKKNLWGDALDARVWYLSATDDTVFRLYGSMKGLGTEEEDLYGALQWVGTEEAWLAVQKAYLATHPKFYAGNLKFAIYSELNTNDVNKAKARLERNGVHYDDKESRVVRPGDVVELLELNKGDVQVEGLDDVVHKAFNARCESLDIELTVWIDNRIIQGALNLPLKVMVDATMHVAPRLLVLGAAGRWGGTAAAEYNAAYPSKGVHPKLFFKKIGDKIEEAYDNFSFTMKCKNIDDYFQRKHSEAMDPKLRIKRITRAVVTWTYSVAGALVTLSTGDDRPYHAQLRLLLEGGHVLLSERTDKGIVWTVMTPPGSSEEDAKKVFLKDIEEQCSAIEEGKGEPLARVIDYGNDGARPVVMLDLRFPGVDVKKKSAAEQALALADKVPSYKGFNPTPKPKESPDYADGNLRTPCATPLNVLWAAPTMLHVLCGLYQIAAVTYGPTAFFEGYHPRKMNCQAFVFDALFVLLMPPKNETPLGSVISWSDSSLDSAPAAPLLRAIKAHVVQDADKMLNAGGDCRLGQFSQTVAEWFMF